MRRYLDRLRRPRGARRGRHSRAGDRSSGASSPTRSSATRPSTARGSPGRARARLRRCAAWSGGVRERLAPARPRRRSRCSALRVLAALVRARPGGLGELQTGEVAGARPRRRRLARAVLRALPAAARARDGRAARAARLGRAARLISAIVLAVHGAADPDLRDPDRQGDRARDDAPLARALAAVDALRRRRTRAADAAGLPARCSADRGDRDATPTTTAARRWRRCAIAFLSAFALELAASLGTALVAVELGIRLVHGTRRACRPRSRSSCSRRSSTRRCAPPRRSSTRAPTGSPRPAACSS